MVVRRSGAGASEAVSSFWGNNAGAATTMNSVTGQQMLAMTKVGPSGVDPISALHQGLKRGKVSRHPSSMVNEGFASDMKNPARKAGGS